jgi:hypothetical protein
VRSEFAVEALGLVAIERVLLDSDVRADFPMEVGRRIFPALGNSPAMRLDFLKRDDRTIQECTRLANGPISGKVN